MKVNDEQKEVITITKDPLIELENTQKMCGLLMKTPHYAKMGQEGMFAIIQTAKFLNVDPFQALQGGLYFVNGKVEMSSRMMAALIRAKKHSITRDSRSNDTACILHGKRADTGDCWTESFSMEEAKKANIYKNAWLTYPRDMLYSRALSRLARQLFPDIIGNCYVEGEIRDAPNVVGNSDNQSDVPKTIDLRTEEEIDELMILLTEVPDYKKDVEAFLAKKDIDDFKHMPKEMYKKVLENAKKKAVEKIEVVEIVDEVEEYIDEED